MANKNFMPTSPGVRGMVGANFSEITKKRPEKSLTEKKSGTGGRNAYGRITLRFRGGGAKRKYRLIDFKREKDGIPARVAAIEYDPNRSARIALLHYADGEKRYILAPHGLTVGRTVVSGATGEIEVGNALALKNIPVGTPVHNIELLPGGGGRIVRSAGTAAQLVAREGEHAQIKLPSGEVRLVSINCKATIGEVGNKDHSNRQIGKAGKTRHMGRRPHNRGTSMNPVDHPHGGGEGRTAGGRHPVSPWGWSTKGKKTRKNQRTQWAIIRDRRKK